MNTLQGDRDMLRALGARSIVLVGMMGAGKTSTGRRLAARLGLPFVDADLEIEAAHKLTIPEIMAQYGEPYFRDGERRVMARLLAGPPRVLATGGGAYMNADTRAAIRANGVSVWLRADPDVLMRRVRRKPLRPLLQTADPEATLRALVEIRYPVYAQADLTIDTGETLHETVVEAVVEALQRHLRTEAASVNESPIVRTVPVALGERAYDIHVGAGLIEDAGRHLAALAPGAACAIVTDAHVATSHLAALQRALDRARVRHEAIVVPAGERSKSWPEFQRVCDAILAARFERGDLVVALGGGVVGDLAGFAAASVRRGMRFVQIPTTLLAQVDSSVGGKTGINSAHGKNLIGAFHQPSLVLIDTAALATLPEREFRAGYAEVVKYALISDAAFFDRLEAQWRAIFDGGPQRDDAIAHCCAMKADVVVRDETERGDRALLNLGHTFGHAFERLVDYDGARLVHGEAVAIGLACAFRFSQQQGLCSGQDAERVVAHLRAVGLPTRIGDIPDFKADADTILDAMRQDKKVQRGALTFILAHGIGKSFVARDVAADAVHRFLQAELAISR
jgi:shikimate kinase/3-dehydroquinate synthase